MMCPGNTTQYCGGPWKMIVFPLYLVYQKGIAYQEDIVYEGNNNNADQINDNVLSNNNDEQNDEPDCSLCPKGTQANHGEKTCNCDPCPVGHNCLEPQAIFVCPNGTYANHMYDTCKTCEPGYYCTDGVRHSCVYCPEPNMTHSATCPPGYTCTSDSKEQIICLE